MWHFNHIRDCLNRPTDGLLTQEQTELVVAVYHRDLDEGCWFACASFGDGEGARFSASSQEEASALARDLAAEVLRKTGRSVPVQEP